jgi:hypothetical protein
MSPFQSRSNTSLIVASILGSLVAAGTAVLGGCSGDDSCGPSDAPATGLVATNGSTTDPATMTFGNLTGGLNGDCPDPSAPSGVTSLTLQGTQTDSGATGFVTICISRPDLLTKQAQTLGLDASGAPALLIDVTGNAANCNLSIDRTVAASGTITADGLCSNGADAAGFAVAVDGTLSLTRMCATKTDSIAVTLKGRVAVTSQPARQTSLGRR